MEEVHSPAENKGILIFSGEKIVSFGCYIACTVFPSMVTELGCLRLLSLPKVFTSILVLRHSQSEEVCVIKIIREDMQSVLHLQESLSTDFREPRMATASRIFHCLAWFCSSLRKGSCRLLWLDVTNAMSSKRSKKGRIQLPASVRGSKMSVLKFPNMHYVYITDCLSFRR